jgi:tetratricopeptide (TPR) repeat protein
MLNTEYSFADTSILPWSYSLLLMPEPNKHFGPFLDRFGRFAAYCVVGQFANAERRVCLIAHRNEERELVKHLDALFLTALENRVSTLDNWGEFLAHSAVVQFELETMSVNSHDVSTTDPEQIAKLVLDSIVAPETVMTPAGSFIITAYETNPDTGTTTYTVKPTRTNNIYTIQSQSREELEGLLNDFKRFAASQAVGYLDACSTALSQGHPREAFRQFFHAYAIENDAGAPFARAERYIQIALVLAPALIRERDSDYAELVANTAAELSSTLNQRENCALAFDLAGLAAHNVGWVDGTVKYFNLALEQLNDSIPANIRALVNFDYGACLVSLQSHIDFTDPSEYSDQLPGFLETAEKHLRAAGLYLDTHPEPDDHLRPDAVSLELARIADLRGDYEGAIRALNSLAPPDTRDQVGRTIYRLAAMRRRAVQHPSAAPDYAQELLKAVEEIGKSASCPADHAVWFLVAMGEMELSMGNWRNAARCLKQAQQILQPFTDRIVCPPEPNAKMGGMLAIDISGRLQVALLGESDDQTADADADWEAFTCAELTKSRFMVRDMTLVDRSPRLGPSYSSFTQRQIANRVARGHVDPRLGFEDYDHPPLGQPKEERREPGGESESYKPIFMDETSQLLRSSDCNAILLSLYCLDEISIAYVLDSGWQNPQVFFLETTRKELLKAAQSLAVGMHGDAFNPCIDPRRPNRHDRFFKPYLKLRENIRPILDLMKSRDLVYVSPHDVWHALPISTLIFPWFWEQNIVPGIVTISSVRAALLLKDRIRSDRAHRRVAGLSSVPSISDSEPQFLTAHHAIKEVFEAARFTIDAAFGKEVTAKRMMEEGKNCRIHHILGHGRFETGVNALDSGLLVSDGSSLPSKDSCFSDDQGHWNVTAREFMAYGNSPQHTTLQSCSMGRSHRGIGDELWGMTRAVLAGGGASVVSPHWDVDLDSSTKLLSEFYRNWLIKGFSMPKALSEAQHGLYLSEDKTEWRHFYHWGAFQLYSY